MGFAGFTGRELDVLALLVNGVPRPEIGKRLGFSRWRTYELLRVIYSKTGFDDVAMLTAWAKANGLDETLPAETSETRAYPGTPKPRQKRIKLGRMRGTETPRRETRMS
ncbi:MAG: helix-turn-helix transcriptional regulator [Acidobacteriia bacterium]|nr:helix-turn-helix transcriptional regulator [Terriglobia bacterium]